MIGAKEDSLGLLVVKNHLYLNDDMVYNRLEEQNKNQSRQSTTLTSTQIPLETDLAVDGKRVTGQKYIDGQVTDMSDR